MVKKLFALRPMISTSQPLTNQLQLSRTLAADHSYARRVIFNWIETPRNLDMNL